MTTNSNIDDCCNRCKTHDGPSFSASEMALTGASSFIAGVSFVVIVIVILKLERNKKMCFRKKEEPFKGKFEGASKKATFKVLKKHTLERKDKIELEDQPKELESEKESPSPKAESAVVTVETAEPVVTTENETRSPDGTNKGEVESKAAEDTEKIESKETDKEQINDNVHVETENKLNIESKDTDNDIKGNINDVDTSGESNTPEKANEQIELEVVDPDKDMLRSRDNDALSSQLFEKSRGSSVYDHEDLVFQNDNFRISALSNI